MTVTFTSPNVFKFDYEDFDITGKFKSYDKDGVTFLDFYFDSRDNFFGETGQMSAEYLLKDNKLYLKFLKTKNTIKNHIDEIAIGIIENSNEKDVLSTNCATIIIDEPDNGYYFIHFNNPLYLNYNGCDTFEFGNSKFINTKQKIDIKSLDNINVINFNGVPIEICTKSRNINKCCKILGFNQRPRSVINYELNQKVKNDVLCIEIK